MAYTLIFSDLDGTLLNAEHEIPERCLSAIGRAKELGVGFVVCTGRSYVSAARYAGKLGSASGYAIGFNGGAVYDLAEEKVVRQLRLSRADALAILAELRKIPDTGVILYNDGYPAIEIGNPATERYTRIAALGQTKCERFEDAFGDSIQKLLLLGANENLVRAAEGIARVLPKTASMVFSAGECLEFGSIDATKGGAMEYVAERLGVPLSDCIAVGDQHNDISMIERAGLGVAVANAVPKAKAAARYVTKASCDEGAIAEIIEKFLEGKSDEKN